eukprot:679683-Amphidinium_carterae.1
MDGKCRWIPHDKNPADAMTKQRGNACVLLRLLRKANANLCDEQKELEQRRQQREETGQQNPRTCDRKLSTKT